jgi:predicted N-formylglutamate amidohydrolase
VLISVHDGRFVPSDLYDDKGRALGIDNPADLERHIAVDLHVDALTSLLAELTEAHTFKVTHSRLVADVNRFFDETECVAPVADGTPVPMNVGLTAEQRQSRLDTYYFPVLTALRDFVSSIAESNGAEPFIVSMHSFARTLRTQPSPKPQDVCVFGYPEFGPSTKIEHFAREIQSFNPALRVGINERFSAKTPDLVTGEDDHRLPCPVTFYNVVQRGNVERHFCLEVCQDLITDPASQRHLACHIAQAVVKIV